ncbi:MAG: M20/M25/M40 family metallo-hydrolase [Planctomycetota bacterium]|nr:M20/M25/M40 family metallo-hydrolase [Planctomycetota bacterium]
MTLPQPVADLMELLAIPAGPGEEAPVAEHLRAKLRSFGISDACMEHDDAQTRSEIGGGIGNLIVKLDGHGRGERVMFSAHMDTVPDCVGAKPRIDGRAVVNDAPGKALGGDNRTGCGVLVQIARALAARKGDHAPVTLVFFVQEEVGLLGSRWVDKSKLGAPARCFNWDSGTPHEIISAVTGTERMHIEISGKAAHAGRPERGLSAAIVAAHALSALDRDGWHGAIKKAEGEGSSNCGILRGGTGSNVVMPGLYALAEARSFDPVFRGAILNAYKSAFEHAAGKVTNPAGDRARVAFRPGPFYHSFEMPDGAPVVRQAVAACRKLGLEGTPVRNTGGMDANWIVAHGIPAVTLGCGMISVHTPDERIDLDWYEAGCRLGIELALAQG